MWWLVTLEHLDLSPRRDLQLQGPEGMPAVPQAAFLGLCCAVQARLTFITQDEGCFWLLPLVRQPTNGSTPASALLAPGGPLRKQNLVQRTASCLGLGLHDT